MRKIVAGLFISLDGVVQGPGPEDEFPLAGWTMPYWDDGIGEFIGGSAMSSDALLLGRVTYQGFAAAFGPSTSGDPMAGWMNSVRKHVVSTTLHEATWNNSTLIQGHVVEAVAALKQQPGQAIGMSGSGTLVQTLLEHNLVDELNLLVYPVVLGQGKRLFKDGSKLALQLMETRTFKTGVVLLSYRPA
ncbi:MAG: dihydrofolate reductase family protein [Candidatus Dormibacteraeota bacterium]|nr:dihydrofolate reductase family protein [Candidatus Dormibacteraeota bacterium]